MWVHMLMALLSSRISLSLRTDGPTEWFLQRMCMYIYILLSFLSRVNQLGSLVVVLWFL